MRRIGLAVLLFMLAVSAGCGSSGPTDLPGSSTLHGRVTSISCAAPGECAAGGYYPRGAHHSAFLVSETQGKWQNAIEVPGMATLGHGARVLSISCAAPGDCVAGGRYAVARNPRAQNFQAFLVGETNGEWGNAIKVPGMATLNAGLNASVVSISCPAPGDCAAGGSYTIPSGYEEAFVVSETNGKWGNAIAGPDRSFLRYDTSFFRYYPGGDHLLSISCASAGECAAGGYIQESSGQPGGSPQPSQHINQAFVFSERNGRWGKAIEVPDTSTTKYANARVLSVSCAAAGGCAAGGYFLDQHGIYRPFVATEKSGAWGSAIPVSLNSRFAEVNSISCPAPGDCVAGGYYNGLPPGHGFAGDEAFVVSETNGNWGKPIEVPGMAALGSESRVKTISCAAAGECVAGGFSYGHARYEAFVVGETGGRWGMAEAVPGTTMLHGGFRGSGISISCPAPGKCAAGGYLIVHAGPRTHATGRRQPFVASERNGHWGHALRVK